MIKFTDEDISKLTGKSIQDIESERVDKEHKQEREQKLKNLFIKYGKIMNLYKDVTYKNSKGEYNSRYFNEIPLSLIDDYFSFIGKDGQKKYKITTTKLRQYYDMINDLKKRKLEGEKLKAELYMILAKANYDKGRKIVPQEFVDFLRVNIDMLFKEGDSKENFIIFKKHFEVVVAYAKGKLKD